MVDSARSKSLTEDLFCFKKMLTASCKKSANLRMSAHGHTDSADKVEVDEKNAIMVQSEEVPDATKRNAAIVGLELKYTLRRVSTQLDME